MRYAQAYVVCSASHYRHASPHYLRSFRITSQGLSDKTVAYVTRYQTNVNNNIIKKFILHIIMHGPLYLRSTAKQNIGANIDTRDQHMHYHRQFTFSTCFSN
jgi:hypothetical protein